MQITLAYDEYLGFVSMINNLLFEMLYSHH